MILMSDRFDCDEERESLIIFTESLKVKIKY